MQNPEHKTSLAKKHNNNDEDHHLLSSNTSQRHLVTGNEEQYENVLHLNLKHEVNTGHENETFLDKSLLTCDPLSTLQPAIYFKSSEYILTVSGNKIAVNSILCGSHKIHMAGRSIVQPGVVLRGDLAVLRIGRYVSIGRGSTLQPPVKAGKGTFGYIPMTIGDYVTIGSNSVISAAAIANNVCIGEDSVIGSRCILKDNCIILPGTVLAPDTVVPPFVAFGGTPGMFLYEIFESAALAQQRCAFSLYNRFHPMPTS